MVTSPSKPEIEALTEATPTAVPRCPSQPPESADSQVSQQRELRPLGGDALQALLAFSAMHQQVRHRRALAAQHKGFEASSTAHEFETQEEFVLDEVLQLVAERASAITGADGLAIALAQNDEIVLRASAGAIKPDVGARIQRDSAFSGACFRTAQIIRCDDTKTDDRVNLLACRRLGARSMVAVPLCGRRRVIGLLEAFSAEPFGFNDSDATSLELLAELVVAALKPEDEDRFAQSAQAAEKKLAAPQTASEAAIVPNLSVPPPAPHASVAVEKPQAAQKTEPLPRSEPEKTSELPVVPKASKPAPSASRRPGVFLVVALVIMAAALGAALWWRLTNSDLTQSAANIFARPNAAAKQSAPVNARSSVFPAGTDSSGSATPSPTSSLPSASSPNLPSSSMISQPDSEQNQAGGGSGATSARAQENTTSQSPTRATHISGIRHWSSSDSSTVVLDLEDQVQYEAHRLANPDRIYFDLHDTSLTPDLEGKTLEIGDPLLARVRVAQPVPGLTRLVLETKGDSTYSVSLEPNPYRLVAHISKIGAPKAQIDLFPETKQAKVAVVVPPPTKEDLRLRALVPKLRIVVDAGHGGWDLGTVGRRGLLEKDLVLEIALRLGKLLETRLGANVILTRSDDTYIPLDERAGIANQARADLFISVHANYSDLPSARGVETYYTNLFSPPDPKDFEMRDDSTPTTKNASAASLTAAELVDKIQQSRRLAASVQRSLYGTLSAQNPGLRDRGVKEASYVVLTQTAMPGILAEVSFVSSPTDEQKLRSDGYRERIAEALYKGVARYAASSHNVKMASR
jgi:N-acetylmuramoyl-L-alanine amidase/putative methionine-R-sulfoxide reductase with GAF domain